eukprot:3883-Heterococcus_DN1.PRE.1
MVNLVTRRRIAEGCNLKASFCVPPSKVLHFKWSGVIAKPDGTVCIMQLMLVLQFLWGQQHSDEIMKFVANEPVLATKESVLSIVKLAYLNHCKANWLAW